jgi:CheY-like chemotaxis protein
VFRKTGKNSSCLKSSFSIFSRLSISPRIKNTRTESQTRNRCSLPDPGNEGRQGEGGGARNSIGPCDRLRNDTEDHYGEVAVNTEYRAESASDIWVPVADVYPRWTQAEGKEHLYVEPGSWVIVAEDDEALRSLFGEALRGKGLQVLPAANGIEAVELYRENADKVWLVVADVIMPGMDGLSAAIEMRKIDDNVFFLFMSGSDPQQIGKTGVNIEDIPNADFFMKPFAFSDMTRRIRMLESTHQA